MEIFDTKPKGFLPKVEVVACYLQVDEKFLFLQRASEKSEPEKWGVPAGKLEKGESLLEGAKRELFEETGINIDDRRIRFDKTLFVRKYDIDFTYHMFKVLTPEGIEVTLSSEHIAYGWFNRGELMKLPLMQGALEALDYFQGSCGTGEE
jgi:8-oxo-dGTP pyrophosphatase MutT (NUDIX family)